MTRRACLLLPWLLACEKPDAAKPLPPEVLGVWHLPEGAAVNMDLKPDGSFIGNANACDSGTDGEGTWEVHPEGGIVLKGKSGSFRFMHMSGDTTSVRFTYRDGTLRPSSASAAPQEIWERGRVCASCGDTISLVPCSEPVTIKHRSRL